MKKPLPTTAKNLATGVTQTIDIPPQVYTSLHDWRPISAEKFAILLHEYMSEDRAMDDFNHSLMTATGYNLDARAEAHIHYIPKERGAGVSSPVLLTMKDSETGKVLCFASTRYGAYAGDFASG